MERLHGDDPPWAGRHVILARLAPEPDQAVPERRFIGRSADGDRTFLFRLPLPGADPARWAIEAEGARRLSIPGFLPVEEVGGTGALPWCTTPYVPALSLPAALRAHGGPLPEPAVRALATALAGTLVTAHAHGVTHAGLSPAAVLLTAEGPRLSCFGAVRAAAPDGERRSGLPGLDFGSLAPEQASGGRPRPLGDVYALGAVLAHASTGHTVPESRELPTSLRAVISACLSRDPARRPQAHEVLAHLGPGASAATYTPSTAHPPTALDATAPVPLPAAVIAELARQSAQVLAAEHSSSPAALD
ncbi:serine/threonine protein kinase [Streptomyces sp. JH34]|uniref:serine/threonine protein kinase n=1 Tax=unclassified Streptomyces TaxID=2593676 RepID=UPI0023F62DD0|nr:serine/threonine protein kinase [Streptomyces sp. JH34]MDF6020264.1 serine/threonine protein kinase [Streptomyces sp. JH34]